MVALILATVGIQPAGAEKCNPADHDCEPIPQSYWLPVNISGSITYFDQAATRSTLSAAKIILSGSDNNINTAYIKADGSFSITRHQQPGTTQSLKIAIVTSPANVNLINHATGNNYGITSDSFSVTAPTTGSAAFKRYALFDPEAKRGYISTNTSFSQTQKAGAKTHLTAAWEATERMQYALNYVSGLGTNVPSTTVFQVDFNDTATSVSLYDPLTEVIHIADGWQVFDEWVVLHELGHALAAAAGTWALQIPGDHPMHLCKDEDTGWAEVLATVFAGMADWGDYTHSGGAYFLSSPYWNGSALQVSDAYLYFADNNHYAASSETEWDRDFECGYDEQVELWGIFWVFDMVDSGSDTDDYGYEDRYDRYAPLKRDEVVTFMFTSNESNDRHEFRQYWIDHGKSQSQIDYLMNLDTIFDAN